MHKSIGDKIGIPDGWIIYWLGDAVAFNCTSAWKTCQHKPYIIAEVLQHKSSIYSEPAELSDYILNCGTQVKCSVHCIVRKCRSFMRGTSATI